MRYTAGSYYYILAANIALHIYHWTLSLVLFICFRFWIGIQSRLYACRAWPFAWATLRHKTTETTVGFVSVAGTMWPKKKTKSTEPPGESVSNGGTYVCVHVLVTISVVSGLTPCMSDHRYSYGLMHVAGVSHRGHF